MKKFSIILALATFLIKYVVAAPAVSDFTVPINLNTGLGEPYVIPSLTITIEHTSIPLLLDTGFAGKADIVLSDKIAKKLHLHYTGKQDCSLSQSGKSCFKEVIISHIKIGKETFSNLKGLVAHGEWGGAQYYKNYIKTDAYDNGVVTLKFLQKFNLLLDYKHHTITFTPLNTALPYRIEKWKSIPFTLANGNITTPLIIHGHAINLVWDTAYLPSQLKPGVELAAREEACPRAAYRLFDFPDSTRCLYTQHQSGLNNVLPEAIFVLKKLGLPDFVPIDGVVGSDYLFSHVIVIDFASHSIFIKYS